MHPSNIVEGAGALSEKLIGKRFNPEQGIAFLKTVKAVASADGFSDREWQALQRRMKELGIADPVQQAVKDYDPKSETFEQVLGAYPKNGVEARMLVLSALMVAGADNLSAPEDAAVRRVAGIVGVSDGMLAVLGELAKAHLLAEAAVKDQAATALDSPLVGALLALRRAIFAL